MRAPTKSSWAETVEKDHRDRGGNGCTKEGANPQGEGGRFKGTGQLGDTGNGEPYDDAPRVKRFGNVVAAASVPRVTPPNHVS